MFDNYARMDSIIQNGMGYAHLISTSVVKFFIPENPIRDAYIFGGWFKEMTDINSWNFEYDAISSKDL